MKKIKSKCWVTDHWVIFNLTIDTYDNIITFLDAQKLLFVADLKLDFTRIPFELHGKGESQNLYQYLANNTDNNSLIAQFLSYFLNIELNMRYFEDNTNINFYFPKDTNWQSFTISVLPPTPPIPPVPPVPNTYGESVLFNFFVDDVYKYIIHNFTTDTNTETLSLGMNSDWDEYETLPVTNRGFIQIYYDDNSTYRIFIIDLDGTIVYQKDVSDYNYEVFNKYCTILYGENEKNYLLVYDGTVRTFEFDLYPEFNAGFSYYLDGGFVISTPENQKYYLIKDGVDTAILFREDAENTYSSYLTYEFSDLITMLTYDSSTYYLLSVEIYNNSGTSIYTYDFTDISVEMSGAYYFSYLNESNSFTMISYDSIYKYVFYYSSVSNELSYREISATYDVSMYYEDIRSYQSFSNFYTDSQLVIFTKDYVTYSNWLLYYDSVFMLPIFKDDDSIREMYEFDSGATKGFGNYTIKRSENYINMLISSDSGNTNYEVLLFSKSSTEPTLLPTDIVIGNLNDTILIYDRTIYQCYDDNVCTMYFVDLDGIEASGLTFTGSSNNYYCRNTFVIYASDIEKTYYTNTSTGNEFVELENYYNQLQTSSSYESIGNLTDGIILAYNQVTELAQIITDTSASASFSIRLIESSAVNKFGFNVGKEYVAVGQWIAQPDGIPYTHTQLNVAGPVDPLSYIMDGTVQSGDNYFGTGSTYFTNMYPGLFVLIAEDIDTIGFKISGNLGADGDGFASGYQYSILGSYSTDYTIFMKRVWDAGDPSVNHIIIVNNDGNGITHEISTNTDNDSDYIYGLSGTTSRVDYLLIAKVDGVMLTNEEISGIVTQYLDIVDGKDINDSLTALNHDYANVTTGITDSIYYFTDSGGVGNINDGGDDMYDGGNLIISLLGIVDPTLIKIGYFNLDGELVDTISSISYDLYADNVYGIRTYGFINNNLGFYTFNGTSISTTELTTDISNSYINDWFWWND